MEEIKPLITTVEGSQDLSAVQSTDLVSVRPEGGRSILLPAGEALTQDRQPLSEAPDGAISMLDGDQAIKLDGVIMRLPQRLSK